MHNIITIILVSIVKRLRPLYQLFFFLNYQEIQAFRSEINSICYAYMLRKLPTIYMIHKHKACMMINAEVFINNVFGITLNC